MTRPPPLVQNGPTPCRLSALRAASYWPMSAVRQRSDGRLSMPPPLSYPAVQWRGEHQAQCDEAAPSAGSVARPCAELHCQPPCMNLSSEAGQCAFQDADHVEIDHEKLFHSLHAQIKVLGDGPARPHTVVVIVDTQDLRQVDHWRHVARVWQSRLRLQEVEHWHLFHVRPQDIGLSQVNYFWAGTFVLESLYVIDPRINYVLIDSDAVPTALWEVKDLAAYARLASVCPSRVAEPVIYLIGEPHSLANAGVVIVRGGGPDAALRGRVDTYAEYRRQLDEQRKLAAPATGPMHPRMQGTPFQHAAYVTAGPFLSAWAIMVMLMCAFAFRQEPNAREPHLRRQQLAPSGAEHTFWQ